MNRFYVEILKREDGRYQPVGESREILAMDEWDAGRRFFALLGLVSLPAPAFALRVRRITNAEAGLQLQRVGSS